MEHPSRSGTVLQSTLVTLPVEILVYIVSFLSTRDKVRIRCISKTLRSVSEVPSLWEDFVWSRYAPRDEKLLKNVLKMFGKHIKRFHFADNIAQSKLEVMLKHCKNVIHLSLPSFQCGMEKLEKMVCSMGNIQILEIPVPVFDIGGTVGRLLFIISSNLKELSLHYGMATQRRAQRFYDIIQNLLQEWANVNYVPKKLNIVIDRKLTSLLVLVSYLKYCIPMLRAKPLQTISGSNHTAWVKIYLKTQIEFLATVPCIQLRITDSSVVFSSVNASQYGILGLRYDIVNLTEGVCHGRKVHKAVFTGIYQGHIDTSVTSLTSVTYFDASHCRSLYPGHLEQLSIACPNLRMLDLTRNKNCLSNLKGLHSLADNCKSLQGVSLKEIHVHDMHGCNCIQLWEILCIMHLIQLAIEHCMIKISDYMDAKSVATAGISVAAKQQRLAQMFQSYSSLKVLEVGVEQCYLYRCTPCHNLTDKELLLITNFPSITTYRLGNLPPNNCYHTLKNIFASKYLRCLYLSKTVSGILSLSLEGHCSSLQQVYIESNNTVPTEAFIDTLCGHGGLEHVILYFKSLSAKSIESIIEHSSRLLTFHVYLYNRAFLKSQLKELTTKIKVKFSKRELFNGGNFGIQVCHRAAGIEVSDDTKLLSVWDCDNYI